MGQEFADTTGRLGRQASQDVLQVFKGFVAIEFGRLHQAHDGGSPLTGPQAAGEQPVLTPERDGPDAIVIANQRALP